MTKPKPKPTRSRHTQEAGQLGSISQHRGFWRIRYRQQVNLDGEVVTVQRSRNIIAVDQCVSESQARELAEKQLTELLGQARPKPAGDGAAPMLMALGAFVEKVYFPQMQRQHRPSTLKGYRQLWQNYLSDRCGPMMLHECETKHVQAWLNELADQERVHSRNVSDKTRIAKLKTHRLTKATLGHIKHFISGVFRFAAIQGYLDGSKAEMVTLAKIPATAPNGPGTVAYSLEEISAMLKALDAADETLVSGTVVMTAAYTALRCGELRGLTWQAYTPGDEDTLGELSVKQSLWRKHMTEPKTEKSKAPVPVIPMLAERLAQHRARLGNPQRGPIFPNGPGRPLSLDWLAWNKIRPVLKEAGIAWHGWHGFRRGLASNLNTLGIDDSVIQSILRHSTVAVTQGHYIKTTSPQAVAAMRRFSDVLNGNGSNMTVRQRKNRNPGGSQEGRKRTPKTVIAAQKGDSCDPAVTQNSPKSGARRVSLIQ